MAFYAEMCRRHWYCVNQQNRIHDYSDMLYKEWYDSLTPEQKEKVRIIKQRRKERTEYEYNTMMAMLQAMHNIVTSKVPDKYRGVYDEFGFPAIK